jgi:hypothetical protein
MGPAVAYTADVAGMGAPRCGGADPDLNDDTGGAQHRVAAPGYLGIGIFDRRDDSRYSGCDDCLGARRRLTVMGAWLQRHIERGAVCRRSGPAQRLGLGMGTAARLGPAAPDDYAFAYYHGQVLPSTRSPSASAVAMKRASVSDRSACSRVVLKLIL